MNRTSYEIALMIQSAIIMHLDSYNEEMDLHTITEEEAVNECVDFECRDFIKALLKTNWHHWSCWADEYISQVDRLMAS